MAFAELRLQLLHALAFASGMGHEQALHLELGGVAGGGTHVYGGGGVWRGGGAVGPLPAQSTTPYFDSCSRTKYGAKYGVAAAVGTLTTRSH